MQAIIGHIRNYIMLVIVSAMIGMLLLIITYAIPNQKGSLVHQNVAESIETLSQFGERTELLSGVENSHLDYYTDSLILNECVYVGEESIIEKALLVPAYDITEGGWLQALKNYISTDRNDGGYIQIYARYWHGHLAIVKPLLLLFSYQELLNVNQYLQLGLAFWVAYLLWKKCGGGYVISYLFSLFCLMPMTVAMSLQFSNMFYVTMIAAVIYLYYEGKMEYARVLPEFFMLLGIITAYIDFLTYPLLAVGMILVLDILCNRQHDFCKQMQRLIIFTVCWGAGYIGMWASKWILVFVFTQHDIFKEAFMMIRYRMEYAVAEETITYSKVIKYNIFYVFVRISYIIPAIGITIYYAVGIIRRIYSKEIVWKNMYAYVYVIALPFIWYGFTANHSCQHHYFTNRTVVVAIFSGFCMMAQLSKEKKDKNTVLDMKKRC